MNGLASRYTLKEAVSVAVAAVVVVALMITLALRLHAATSVAGVVAHVPAPMTGKPAPDFTFPVWNGKSGQTIQLSALKGTPIVVNFWASWCEPCNEEMPLLQAAWQSYGTRGVVFLGLALDTSKDDGLQFMQQHGVTYPCGPVPSIVAPEYALPGLPDTIVIDRNGIVSQRFTGELAHDALDQAIATVLS